MLADGFRGFSPSCQEGMAEQSSSHHGSQEIKCNRNRKEQGSDTAPEDTNFQ
jgi:hypothetical protein